MFKRALKFILPLVLVLAIAGLSGCSSASPTPTQAARTTIPSTVGYLQILVMDSNNSPLTGAKVVSQTQPGSQLSVNGITTDGSVKFGPIVPGVYQFGISQANFQSTVAVVEVIAGQSIQITVNLQKSS
jgi:hypothetical protein